MSMKEELIEVVKALILPELMELKQGMTELKAELKVTNARLDLLEERYDDLRDQMNQRFDEMKDEIKGIKLDIAEVRSYVWTSGLDARRQEQFKLVREQSEQKYGNKT